MSTIKSQTSPAFTIALASVLTLSTACGAPATLSSEPAIDEPVGQQAVAETVAVDETSDQVASDEATVAVESDGTLLSEEFSIPCVTWSEYQAADPQMPPGFETGCVFRVGQGMSASVDILRNDIGLETIAAAGVTSTEYTDGPIPWFQGREVGSTLAELRENGDVITYYQACVTLGGQTSNCEGFPEDEAYIINDDTACLNGECLNVPGVHAVYLLSLWDWEDTIYGLPTSFSAEQTVIRNQYRTVPLNQLSPDVPLVGVPENIALSAFGRTTLGEGEQPTTVRDDGYNRQDDIRTIYLTNKGLADDSIGGYRYRFDFTSSDGDMSKLIWVGEQQYCWRTSEWTRERCP